MYSNVKIFNTVNIGHTFMSFCDARDCSMHSSVHGIFQARIVEWVTISFSRGSSQLSMSMDGLTMNMDMQISV